MGYQPVEQIPLQDLSLETTPDLIMEESESDQSDTSELFGEINEFSVSKNTDLEDFLADPDFQRSFRRFKGEMGFTRRTLLAVFGTIFAVWVIALIIYSNGNARKVATGVWHGSPTNQVLLGNRNVLLNAFLPNNKNMSFETYRRGSFFPDHKTIQWLNPAQFPKGDSDTKNGYYLTSEDDKVVVRQANTDFRQVLLEDSIFAYKNNFFQLTDIELNPGKLVDDGQAFHLLKSDVIRQWRHSTFALYWLWQPVSGDIIPVQPPGDRDPNELEKLHFAHFSPSGDYLILGYNHDLYAMEVASQATAVLTDSQSRDIFHGKPDWVYEEEVFGDDNMIWWSPDLKKMVYASIDDTDVADYELSYFVKSPDNIAMSYNKRSSVNQYPVQTSIKYPKPGTNNPIISLHVFNVEDQTLRLIKGLADEFVGDDFILYDATWIDEDHLLLRIADRTSTILEKKVYVVSEQTAKFVSRIDTSEFHGWVEKTSPITVIKVDDKIKYLDKVVADDKVQLALFDLADAEHYLKLLGPIHYDSAVAFDANEKLVYAVWGTNNNQSFGLVSLADGLSKFIEQKGKIVPSFSPDGQYVELSYEGPLEPWQKLINVADFSDPEADLNSVTIVNDMKSLSKSLLITNIPTKVYSTVKVGHGDTTVELNMIEIFPPNFDPSRKHPLLVNAYGGPGSTSVDQSFSIGFHEIVSAQLDAVVLVIDPRGTGSDDWKLKRFAFQNIGYWEPRDITDVVQDYIKVNKYVDDKRTAIWGWSYGGFTTLKTLEYDGGNVFKYGMAVAPVTNWLFYDSIYTERYMKSPDTNQNYDLVSAITDYLKFTDVRRFLIMHGTADDNVHIQNSLWLLDQFDMAEVENYDVHFFPDSDHSIYFHNANTIVYDKLLRWLGKAFKGAYD